MKVRIGVSPGRTQISYETLNDLVHAMEATGFDSLWLSEVLTGAGIDPFVGLTWAAAQSARLKIGTTMLLPGRNLVRLAKALSSLDVLSDGRLLVTFVPGLRDSPEREAIGVAPAKRGRVMDETLPLLRRLLAGESIDDALETAGLPAFSLQQLPVQQPLEFWLGGLAPAALERCGVLGDGWLPSLCTPEQALSGKLVIDEAAKRSGRLISPEHFGVSIPYIRAAGIDDQALSSARRRPNGELVPVGMAALRDLLERFVNVGFSKFVVRPVHMPTVWKDELEELAEGVGDLQS